MAGKKIIFLDGNGGEAPLWVTNKGNYVVKQVQFWIKYPYKRKVSIKKQRINEKHRNMIR